MSILSFTTPPTYVIGPDFENPTRLRVYPPRNYLLPGGQGSSFWQTLLSFGLRLLPLITKFLVSPEKELGIEGEEKTASAEKEEEKGPSIFLIPKAFMIGAALGALVGYATNKTQGIIDKTSKDLTSRLLAYAGLGGVTGASVAAFYREFSKWAL